MSNLEQQGEKKQNVSKSQQEKKKLRNLDEKQRSEPNPYQEEAPIIGY